MTGHSGNKTNRFPWSQSLRAYYVGLGSTELLDLVTLNTPELFYDHLIVSK